MKIQENQGGLKFNGAYEVLVHANDVYLFGYNINAEKKNT
jgi:hypothetical protein